MEQKHVLEFKEKIPREQNAISLIFQPQEEFRWNAGQAMEVHLPHENMDARGDVRTFSISSAPSEGFVMITTRNYGDDASSFKKALFNLEQGDTVEVSGPFNSRGNFEAENPALDYIFLVGGVGVTPVRSIMKEYELTNKQLKGTLIFANRDDQYIFGEELDEVAKKFARFTVQPYHTRRIDEFVVSDLYMRYPTGIFEVSGPPTFIDEITMLLQDAGVSERNIKSSTFKGGYTEI